MEHLGNSLSERQRADRNITSILNPVPAIKKRHDAIAREVSQMLGREW